MRLAQYFQVKLAKKIVPVRFFLRSASTTCANRSGNARTTEVTQALWEDRRGRCLTYSTAYVFQACPI